MQGREIKFRIWDKDLKKMRVCGTDIHDSIAFDMDNNAVYYNMQNGCGSLADGTGTYDLMRFTGLRDKNGKEIYEGDIIRVEQWNMNGIVNFASGMFKVSDPIRTEFNPSLASFMVEVRCEVIGNIYENPELLEVGN
ncbi:YopX family protein [Brevibacillus borstelensis]|uniref:YopX family protein n=1 Tax=Brevibacillus borstelensis TaxID=45462 RepID=UPI0004F3393A|nr:YopX family protein [Brevibacillus borstelensis]KKX52469.1 hypothetical protein X546_24990 [Brevibacillus borstelensis cifa_chp40]